MPLSITTHTRRWSEGPLGAEGAAEPEQEEGWDGRALAALAVVLAVTAAGWYLAEERDRQGREAAADEVWLEGDEGAGPGWEAMLLDLARQRHSRGLSGQPG